MKIIRLRLLGLCCRLNFRVLNSTDSDTTALDIANTSCTIHNPKSFEIALKRNLPYVHGKQGKPHTQTDDLNNRVTLARLLALYDPEWITVAQDRISHSSFVAFQPLSMSQMEGKGWDGL